MRTIRIRRPSRVGREARDRRVKEAERAAQEHLRRLGSGDRGEADREAGGLCPRVPDRP